MDSRKMDSRKIAIAPDTIVLISGASGVGKTTIARALLQHIPEFIVMQEVDLLREVLRTSSLSLGKQLAEMKYVKSDIESLLNTPLLMKSTSELTVEEIKQQTRIINESIRSICERLQRKRTPAVIEGVNISLESLFKDIGVREFFFTANNMYLINLYMNDEAMHRKRLEYRTLHAGTSMISDEQFKNVRAYHDHLFIQTQKYIDQNQTLCSRSRDRLNVLNIDVSAQDVENVLSRIILCITSEVDYEKAVAFSSQT